MGHPLQKRVGWIQQQFVTPAKIHRSRHAWPWPWHAESDWVRVSKTETEIGTPGRVEAETWKFARQRGSSRAVCRRGLYSLVQWNWFSDVIDACNSGASSDHREPISLHQAVCSLELLRGELSRGYTGHLGNCKVDGSVWLQFSPFFTLTVARVHARMSRANITGLQLLV